MITIESDKFCLKCGIDLKENPPIIYKSKPKKPYPKIIGASVSIVIIIAVIIFLFIFILHGNNGIMGGTSDDKKDGNMNQSGKQNQNQDISKFLGEWNIDFENYSGIIIIKSDNTIEFEYLGLIIEIGTWSIDDEEICIVITQDLFDIGIEDSQCFSYSFSDDDSILVLSSFGIDDIVLTK